MRSRVALAVALGLLSACKQPSRGGATAAATGSGSAVGSDEALPPGIVEDVKAIADREHATAQHAKGTIQLARAWRYASGPALAPGRSWVAVETDFGSLPIDTDDLEAADPDSKAVSPIGDVRQLDANGGVTSFGGAHSNERHFVLFFDVGRNAKRLELRYWGETLSAAPVAIADTGPEYPAASRAVIRHFARGTRHVLLIEDHNQADPPSSITHHLMAGKEECKLAGLLPVTASLALADRSTEPIIAHAFYLADYTCTSAPDGYGISDFAKPIPAPEQMAIPTATLEALEGRGPDITVIQTPKVFTHVAVTRDGSLLAIAPVDRSVRLVDPQGKERTTLTGLSDDDLIGIGFTPDGKQLWTVQDNGLVLVWDVASGKQLASRTVDPDPSSDSNPAVTADGRYLIVDHPWDDPDQRVGWPGQLLVLSLPDLVPKGTIQIVKGDKGSLKNFSLAADGKSVLACATTEDTAIVRVYALPAGKPVTTVKAPTQAIAACTLTSDNRIVLGAEGGEIYIYDRSGTQLGNAAAHRGGTYILHPRDDGTFVSGGADGTVSLWPKRGATLEPQPVARHKYPVIGLDALGPIVLSVANDEVILTDIKTHERIQRMHGSPDGPESTAMAPGIVAVSEMLIDLNRGRVRIWHVPPR